VLQPRLGPRDEQLKANSKRRNGEDNTVLYIRKGIMKRLLVGIVIAASMVIGMGTAYATTPSVTSAATSTDVTYHQMFQQGNTAKCLYTGNTTPGTHVSYVTCAGGPLNTEWSWTVVPGEPLWYVIENHNGTCLTDPGSGGQGTSIETGVCVSGNLSQEWEPSTATAGSTFQDVWVNIGGGLCMDGGNNLIREWECNGTVVQTWNGPL
jgi:hypothetical protein